MPENNNFKELSKEVYYAIDKIPKFSKKDIDFLKEKMVNNNLQRIRICAHKDIDDRIHEMFIVLIKNTYIRPHKHLNKPESFHLIDGSAKVIIFDDKGKIEDVIGLDNYNSGKRFYYRMDNPYYHTVFVTADFLVFHETTGGPFQKSDTVFAPWAPEESDITSGKKYMEQLVRNLDDFLSKSKKST